MTTVVTATDHQALDLPSHFPTVDAVAHALVEHTADLPRLDDEADEGHDYRLQVLDDGQWFVHVGDASYDNDHHGSWGAGVCFCPIELGAAAWEAVELLKDAAEEYWQSRER